MGDESNKQTNEREREIKSNIIKQDKIRCIIVSSYRIFIYIIYL